MTSSVHLEIDLVTNESVEAQESWVVAFPREGYKIRYVFG